MHDGAEAVLRQKVCGGHACRAVFWLCLHCDRGQRYCSLACRQTARREQCRRANQRHQQSEEGRLDHCDRQRAYRSRQNQARVTDQGSVSRISPALSSCEPVAVVAAAVLAVSCWALRHRYPETGPGKLLSCRICGRRGRFTDTSPRIFRRRR